jgi:hypothetical protein
VVKGFNSTIGNLLDLFWFKSDGCKITFINHRTQNDNVNYDLGLVVHSISAEQKLSQLLQKENFNIVRLTKVFPQKYLYGPMIKVRGGAAAVNMSITRKNKN